MVTRRTWKRFEGRVAAKIGTHRIPVSGRQGPGADQRDVLHDEFYIEVRDRQRARPLRWMLETWQETRGTGRKPMVVFKGPAGYLSPLVIMRWADFAEVYRRGERGADAGPHPERPGQPPAGPVPEATG